MQRVKVTSITLGVLLYFFIIGGSASATAATVTWGGGGTDYLASNLDNWSGGNKPQYGDDVVFDVTSSKNCTWDFSVTLLSLSINTGYTGTVTLSSSADLHISDIITTPAAPSDLTATVTSSSQIDLSWTDNSDTESGFKIERKTGSDGTYLEVGSVETNITAYSDTDPLLTPDSTYYYQVKSFNPIGDSGYSNEVSATTFSEDDDGDGIENASDNCPFLSNPDQLDADWDNIGDICDTCTDSDRDGYGNPGYAANTCQDDNCKIISNSGQEDVDGDSIGDACDNCPTVSNVNQLDTNNDGIGDECTAYHCVSTTAELQQALSEAQSNGMYDIIRIEQGSYTDATAANPMFNYVSQEIYGMYLAGGYTNACSARDLNPENTVLIDGTKSLSVLYIINNGGVNSSVGRISVEGITVNSGYRGVFILTDGNQEIVFSRNIVSDNFVHDHTCGGGDLNTNGKIIMSDNVVTGNRSYANGGGICVEGDMGVELYRNIITSNTIWNNIPWSYGWDPHGGGMYIITSRDAVLLNNIVADNANNPTSHVPYGGGIYAEAENLTLINNTITGNIARRLDGVGSGGGLEVSANKINIYNNIIWGNLATSSSSDMDVSGNTTDAFNNDYDPAKASFNWNGIHNSGNNINANPMLDSSYRLTQASPARNMGSNAAPSLPSADFEGHPRIAGGTVDMGADEYQDLLTSSFIANPFHGTAPLTVNFKDISFSTQGPAVSWEWDFDNDGAVDSTLQHPSYTYNSTGIYTVSLTVMDSVGNSDTSLRTDYIEVDIDSDGDDIIDSRDNCPFIANIFQDDGDEDGVGDVCDNCPAYLNADQSDIDNDGTGDICDDDIDADGLLNAADNCPSNANTEQIDVDEDGVGDVCDNCPTESNSDQSDIDYDGTGDVCDDDIDGDGLLNAADNCPSALNPDQLDIDEDGAGDVCDNCLNHANPDQRDTDEDGIGDSCDNCPTISSPDQHDTDQDGIGDVCDNCAEFNPDQIDDDFDAIGAVCDNCPGLSNSNQFDLDDDGIGDVCDDSTDLLNISTYITALKNVTDNEINTNDVSALMVDGLFTDSRTVQRSQGKYSAVSFRSDIEAADLASSVLKIYISDLSGSAQPAKVYAYNSDGISLQTATAVDVTLTAGWNDLDVTQLLTLMQGYGYIKFRVVYVSGWFDVAEAQITGTSDRTLDDWSISVNPTPLDFGSIDVGGYSGLGVTVSNVGTGDLVIGTIGAPTAPFEILSDECSGQTLLDSMSCSVIITFTPASAGVFTESLLIPSNDGDNLIVLLNVTGSASTLAALVGTVTDSDTGLPVSDAMVTVKQIRNINLSPSDVHHTYGKLTNLPSDDSDLSSYAGLSSLEGPYESYRYNDGQKIAVANNSWGGKYCVNLFKFKNPLNNTDSIKVTWNGVSGGSGYEFYSQSFQPEIAGPLTKVSLYLGIPGNATSGYVSVYLKSALGSEVDNILAVSDAVPMNAISNEHSWTDFYFSTPVFLNKDQTYYLEVNKPTETLTINMGVGTVLSYNRGQNYRRDYGAWKSYFQLLFKTYINDTIDQQQTAYYREEILSGYYDKSVTSQIYNKSTNSWIELNIGYSSGGYDFDIENTIATNLNDYYDIDGWVSARVISIYDSFVSLATDLYQAEFERSESTITDSNGQYILSELNSGNYTVTSTKLGYEELEVSGTLSPGETQTLDVQLSIIPSLSGTVREIITEGGQPLEGVTVTVIDSTGTSYESATDSIGFYAIKGPAAGNFTATFTKADYIGQTETGIFIAGQTVISDIEMTPVSFMITSPADGAVIDLTPVTVTGYVESNSTVTVNGIPATVTGYSFSASVPLIEGQNTITAIATDQFSQTQTLNISVTLFPPIIVTIHTPQNGSTVHSSPVTVTGDVFNTAGTGGYSEEHAQSFKPVASGELDAIALILTRVGNAGGDLYVKITTQPGGSPVAMSNMISAMSVSLSHNEWKTFSFSVPPQVTAGNTYYMELWRTVHDNINYIEWWKVHGGFVTDYYSDGMTYRSDSGIWSDLGPYVDTTFRVYIDSQLDIMQGYWSTGQNQLAVYGVDPNLVDVTVNGVSAAIIENSFSAQVPLTEGPNTITAVASDQYGHVSSDSIAVSLELKGSITGTVTDSSTGLPIASATVSVTDSLNDSQNTSTAADGTFVINDVAQGTISGTVTKTGYVTYLLSGFVLPQQTVTVDAALDPMYPVISNISVSNITEVSATISWTTDLPSDSKVDYGATSSYGSSVSDAALMTSHSLSLTDLLPGTIYHFKITSTSSLNTSSSSVDNAFTTLSTVSISITSPLGNDMINRPDVMVKGTVTNTLGYETGVTVNGIVAVVYNGEFFVNHVPLQEGQNTISAVAVDKEQIIARYEISADADHTIPHVTLQANIESGIAPLNTYFSVSTSIPHTVTSYDLDYEGNAIIDYSGTSFENMDFTYHIEGVYYPTITVTDDQNNTYTDTIALVVLNQTDFDALLQSKWNGMKTALMAGDISSALNYFVDESKSRYNNLFDNLGTVELNAILSSFEGFELLSQSENMAECGLIRTESGGIFAYPLIFVKDEIGVWKMYGF